MLKSRWNHARSDDVVGLLLKDTLYWKIPYTQDLGISSGIRELTEIALIPNEMN